MVVLVEPSVGRNDLKMTHKESSLLPYLSVFLLSTAIFIGLYLRYQASDQHLLNIDAVSAINRAKTKVCKEELKSFALSQQSKVIHRLERHCKLDFGVVEFKKVGCAKSSSDGLINIERSIHDLSSCLDICLSYGHSFGGFENIENKCYCADKRQEECDQDKFDWYEIKNGLYSPESFSSSSSQNRNSIKEIRIAFVLVVKGKNLNQIQRLLKHVFSPRHLYYIHVDGRDEYLFQALSGIYRESSNFIFASRRLNTIWGGTSLLQMYLNAMEDLAFAQWDFLINLSESDYPVKPLNDLESYLSERPDMIFLKSHSMKGYSFIKKQGLERTFYQCEDHLWHLGPRNLPVGIVYSGGSDWFVLPRNFCSYVTDHKPNHDSLVSSLIDLFNHTLLPAESFFHTLALNSEFCDNLVDDNLRFTNWDRKRGCKCQHKDVVDWCGCSPLVYRRSDWSKLNQTRALPNVFFSRKFDPTISSTIISMVDKYLLNATSEEEPDDTRYLVHLWPLQSDQDSLGVGLALRHLAIQALEQIEFPRQDPHNIAVGEYFDQDRFVGLVFRCCFNSTEAGDCIQFLLERRLESHLTHFDPSCFKSEQVELKLIEVNHGFDIGEQMFRRYDPLTVRSNVIVYHEWLTSNITRKFNDQSPKLRFNWIDPHDKLKLRQRVDLRKSTTKTKLSLAHKLSISKPLDAGLWKLQITLNSKHCLEYRFLVLAEDPSENRVISQKDFNDFFNVTHKCLTTSGCKQEHWVMSY